MSSKYPQGRPKPYDCIIAGAGLAGLATVLNLARSGLRVMLLERGPEEQLGGLARQAFGGIFLTDSRQQRRLGIKDSTDLALADWLASAEFTPEEVLQRRWAEHYVAASSRALPDWLDAIGVRIFPVVHWVERGLFRPGNSLPRFHLVWGAGYALVKQTLRALEPFMRSGQVDVRCGLRAESLELQAGRVGGINAAHELTGEPFEARAPVIVLAAGGFCGDLKRVRRHWNRRWAPCPQHLLSGAHPFCDGRMLDASTRIGARASHLDEMWCYAAGVHHPTANFADHGLSLVPCRSALWVNAHGERIGPEPMVAGFDTRRLVQQLCQQPGQFGWQILNRDIAIRELAVSGAEFNQALRKKQWVKFLWQVLRGNHALVDRLCAECENFVVASDLDGLATAINARNYGEVMPPQRLAATVARYDAIAARPTSLHNDDQLRRLAQLRRYRGDRLRTAKPGPIVIEGGPLIAIRTQVLTRKSLGGIETDLNSRVLDTAGNYLPGLFAVGEIAGFGGGGMHGRRALEGTFLGGCIVTALKAAAHITAKEVEL